MTQKQSPYAFAGFWIRFVASVIDGLLMAVVTIPLLYAIYGQAYFESEAIFLGTADMLINYVLPIVAIVAFWVTKGATPGKMAMGVKVIDLATGEKPKGAQALIRYVGYFVSGVVFCLGYLWIVWDNKKQGWHDKIAGTAVVYKFASADQPKNERAEA